MKKRTELWSISELQERYATIHFAEYQREPNVWSRDAKQRLVDSILRGFDIASLYFYVNPDGSMDCVDGRQRIGAIMSFLNLNLKDSDNGFEFKVLNEIYLDSDHPFASFDRTSFEALRANPDPRAKVLTATFLDYEVTATLLSDSKRPREFNLQFTRLNLGTIVNSGEKLNAMVGDLRDVCFEDLGKHDFLESTRVPTRRFSRQQLAAQILCQVFSIESKGSDSFTTTRHIDIQNLFKHHATLDHTARAWIAKTRQVMDHLHSALSGRTILRNRAIVVSAFLLAYEHPDFDSESASDLATFLDEFLCRLSWQVQKGLDADDQYRYLLDFQRHITQASVETRAVRERARTLRVEFHRWRESKALQGDAEYQQATKRDPSVVCRSDGDVTHG